jgi:4-amino-4-deoxy-L-arabinose transferase-like glycosyltransferase
MLKRFRSSIQSHKLFIAILIAYLTLAFGFSVANPIYESTDELHHFRYIRYMQEFGELPQQRDDQPRIQAHHPPLYYLLADLATIWIQPDHPALYEPVHNPYYGYRYWEINNDNKNQYLHGPAESWPYHGVVLTVHVARWVNVLLGALMVFVTYKIGLTIFARSNDFSRTTKVATTLAAGATAIVAFNPQFLFMSGAVNNDVIAGLFGSILLWQGLIIIRESLTTKRSLWLGIAFGFALIAKFNLAFALPLIELALLISIWPKRDWHSFIKANAIILVGVVVIAGWWFVRNYYLYKEPTGVQQMNALWGGRDPRESFWLAVSEIPYAWTSLWGRFGYGQIPMSNSIYIGALIVTAIALIGLIAAIIRRRSIFDAIQIKQLPLIIFSALLFAAALFGYMMSSTAGPMGRFYFPGLSAFGLLMAIGLFQVSSFRLQVTRYSSLVVPALAFALALVSFFGYFIPAYAQPKLIDANTLKIDQPINITFDGKIELLGAQIDRTSAQPGEPIRVTLYWRALQPIDQSYVEFVHLIDQDGIIVAQRDTWPGRGMFPTVLWRAGETFADSLTLDIPETAFAPNNAKIQVGLFAGDGTRLAALDASGNDLDQDAVSLNQVSILPRPGGYLNPIEANFGNKVDLMGYDMTARSILPGQAVTVTLYWRSRSTFTADYAVFLNALRPTLRTSAQDTGKPINGHFSTQVWQVGQVITDVRVLQFPITAKVGQLDVEVGWFLPKGDRLDVLGADGHVIDSRVLLSPIRIREK